MCLSWLASQSPPQIIRIFTRRWFISSIGQILFMSNMQTEFNSYHQHDYQSEPRLRDMPLTLMNLPRMFILALIRLYQMTFSKAMPQNTCRFYPSCSHYGYQAVYKFGLIKGSLMAAWRVLRCNPFNPGGYDPVP
jgi:uncharacterized protein